MVLLLGSFWWQNKVRPFVYTFQNSIETWLLLSNFLAIVLVRNSGSTGRNWVNGG